MEDTSPYVCKLDAKTIQKAKDELNENPSEREGAIQQLRDWIRQQPHFRCPTGTKMLLGFLRGSKFSQLRAREMIEKNLSMGQKIPEWFRDIDSRDAALQEILNRGYCLPLPKRDENGCQILLYRLNVLDPKIKNLSVVEEIRAGMIIGSYVHESEESQINGCVFIFDMGGLSAKQMTRWKLEDIRKWFNIWQKNIPGRFKALHYLNAGNVFETIMGMARPFMTKKFQDRMLVHQTVEKMYKHIPMELLPLEYLPDDYKGPHQGTVDELTKNCKQAVTEEGFRQMLMARTSAKYGIDEDKRPQYAAPQEAFRKLNVD